MGFFKVLPLQIWQGFGAFWKRRAVVFLLPLCLYVPPSLMISISFSFIFCGLCLLLPIIHFPLQSAITLSFCTHIFHSSCSGLSGPFLSVPWSLFLHTLRIRRESEGCAALEMCLWVRSWCQAPHTWVGSALRHGSRANGEHCWCLLDLGLVTFDSVQC